MFLTHETISCPNKLGTNLPFASNDGDDDDDDDDGHLEIDKRAFNEVTVNYFSRFSFPNSTQRTQERTDVRQSAEFISKIPTGTGRTRRATPYNIVDASFRGKVFPCHHQMMLSCDVYAFFPRRCCSKVYLPVPSLRIRVCISPVRYWSPFFW